MRYVFNNTKYEKTSNFKISKILKFVLLKWSVGYLVGMMWTKHSFTCKKNLNLEVQFMHGSLTVELYLFV